MFCITTKPTCLCSWHLKAKDGMCKMGKDAISTVCIYCKNTMLAGTEVCLSWTCVKYSHYLSIPSPLERSTIDKIFLCLRSTLKILSSPSAAAKCKTELPWRSRRLTSAPALSKSSTTSACLVITARCKGVYKGQSQEKISSRNLLNPQKLLLWEDVPPAPSWQEWKARTCVHFFLLLTGFLLTGNKSCLASVSSQTLGGTKLLPALQSQGLTCLFEHCGARDLGNEMIPVPHDTVTPLPAAHGWVYATEGAPVLSRACSNWPWALGYVLILLPHGVLAAMGLGFPCPPERLSTEKKNILLLCAFVKVQNDCAFTQCVQLILFAHFPFLCKDTCSTERLSDQEASSISNCIWLSWQSFQWTESCTTPQTQKCMYLNSQAFQ